MLARFHLNRILNKATNYRFATVATTNDFQSKYAEFVMNRNKRIESAKAYTHPLENEDRPINFGPTDLFRFAGDAMGPEQVSTHYESFFTSRRFVLTAIGSIFFFSHFAKVADLNWILLTTMTGLPLYFAFAIFFYEIPKYQFLPFLNSFYVLTFRNEIKMMQDAVPDDIQTLVSKNMKEALEQFDYLLLHKKFKGVKEQSIETFLLNQELDLKQSIKERAVDLLKMAEEFETNNQKQVLNKIIQRVEDEIDAVQKNPSQKILDAAFEAALLGVRDGKMSYQGDAVLPHVIEKIRNEVGKFKGYTPEEFYYKT